MDLTIWNIFDNVWNFPIWMVGHHSCLWRPIVYVVHFEEFQHIQLFRSMKNSEELVEELFEEESQTFDWFDLGGNGFLWPIYKAFPQFIISTTYLTTSLDISKHFCHIVYVLTSVRTGQWPSPSTFLESFPFISKFQPGRHKIW